MIDVRLLRTQPDVVRAALARRAKPDVLEQADHALRLDVRLRDITTERDAARARVNELSKQVAELRRAKQDADVLMAESRALGDREKVLADEYAQVEAVLRDVLLRIPNLPHDEVTQGTSSDDNRVVRGPEQMPAQFAAHQRVPHWETGAALGILDSERAVKISGAMFTMQRGAGAALARALCQYALDRNADAYEEIRPPSLVTTATLTATGQLPKFADDAYSIERDDLWCIPTAEVPLTSLARDEILRGADLPMRLMAQTACFRREAGSAGRDTRGLLRVHEFDKVEILAYATPEQAAAVHADLLARAEGLIGDLGLTYHV
ncbi:MAG: serine--tRNA ligase, partial [Actinobacteria bacterium]|nr:serine--tRNA ligase [Actinomycetota bacterium]